MQLQSRLDAGPWEKMCKWGALTLCVLALLGVLQPSFVTAELRAGGGLGSPLPPPNPSLGLFLGLLDPWGLQPDTPMRLKGGAGDENIKIGESKPKARVTKGKSGKPLSKYNQFMQIEVPKVRVGDSSLTHAQAFSVQRTSYAREIAPGRQKIGQQRNVLLPVRPRLRSIFSSFFTTSMQLRALRAAQAPRTRASARASKTLSNSLRVLLAWTFACLYNLLCAPSLFPDSLMLRQAAAKHWSAKSKEEKAAWAP